MHLFQRVFKFISRHAQLSYRDRQTIAGDFDPAPRGRVTAGSFGCVRCGGEFASFMELRGHVCRGAKG